jgi:hypothetical protein
VVRVTRTTWVVTLYLPFTMAKGQDTVPTASMEAVELGPVDAADRAAVPTAVNGVQATPIPWSGICSVDPVGEQVTRQAVQPAAEQ